MKRTLLCLPYCILIAISLLSCRPTEAPEETKADVTTRSRLLYFPETGHTIQAPFLTYYLAHNGFARLGYPITETIEHEGWQVQYFQNARLEVHPENHPTYFITVGWLGQLSHRRQPPIYRSYKTEHRYFPESGHTLSGDFLAYFEANGETVQFGYPISEPFIDRGHISQDFQSARFIWRPNLPPPARVRLEPLGENYFLRSGLPLSLLDPVPPPPKAEQYSQRRVPLPERVDVGLVIEPTPNPSVIRVVVTLFHQGSPLPNYAPRLIWANNQQQLPPTGSSGQTHSLVNIAEFNEGVFTLYTTSGTKRLKLLAYQKKVWPVDAE